MADPGHPSSLGCQLPRPRAQADVTWERERGMTVQTEEYDGGGRKREDGRRGRAKMESKEEWGEGEEGEGRTGTS